MLDSNEIEWVQVEAVALPGESGAVEVDDVVVSFISGERRFIQAKKNQSDHRAWSLSDLKAELLRARAQLEECLQGRVELCSRTPFGDLAKLVEGHADYGHVEAFSRQAPASLTEPFEELVAMWERSAPATFALLSRIDIGPLHTFDDWDRLNLSALDGLVTQPGVARTAIERLVCSSQSGLRRIETTLSRDTVVDALQKESVHFISRLSLDEIRESFARASAIGRQWDREIAGKRIPRGELEAVRSALADGNAKTILLKDGPGTGKTCALLDVADFVEEQTDFPLLFIKGDHFAECRTEAKLEEAGLPSDVVGKAAALSKQTPVVVVVDSLDVLSIHREHKSLRLLINLVDRLQTIPNVEIVVACRAFDLAYDPLLRNRDWSMQVELGRLSFDQVVAPLLQERGIAVDAIDPELRGLLEVPQNLKIFVQALQRSDGQPSRRLRTVHDLQRHYLETVVRQNEHLGEPAMLVLTELADWMVQRRVLRAPIDSVRANREIVQRLVSEKVLAIATAGTLQFAHQTLLDSVAVRAAITSGQSLADFILSKPPFPFLRPIVREFIAHLRVLQPGDFARQIRKALSGDVAYHLRRAIVECLAELPVSETDWPLVRAIWREHPDLFQRLLWRVVHRTWFRLLLQSWWPSLPSDERKLRVDFLSRLDRWMNEFTDDVLRLWMQALGTTWAKEAGIGFRVQIQLDKFTQWNSQGVREFLEALVATADQEHSALGKVLSRYVEATEGNDDLLWDYIKKDVDGSETDRIRLGDDLKCQPHEFHTRTFLHDRLRTSDPFLTAVLESLDGWVHEHGIDTTQLFECSWADVHQDHDLGVISSGRALFDGVEAALRQHARGRDDWWVRNEPRFRTTNNAALRYLLIRGYQEDAEENRIGIAAQLLDAELHRRGDLEHELGELAREAYPVLDEETQRQHQGLLLSRLADYGPEEVEWAARSIYDSLLYIPSLFRTPETQAFVDRWSRRFGEMPLPPRLHLFGGSVRSPVGFARMLGFSDAEVCRLLEHYNGYERSRGDHSEYLFGGRSELCNELRECASRDPNRYLNLLQRMSGCHVDFLHAILRGVAENLSYRFGRLKAPTEHWPPPYAQPDREDLVERIVGLCETMEALWCDEWAMARIVEGCACATARSDNEERVTWLLFRVARSRAPEADAVVVDPGKRSEPTARDFRHAAINRPRGIGATAAMNLYCRIAGTGGQPPELLEPLLMRFAGDEVASVRAAILEDLPRLQHHAPGLGWKLLHEVLTKPNPHIWSLVERVLYHQLDAEYDRVEPLLRRMRVEGGDAAGAALGRLSALAVLDGRQSLEEFLGDLEAWDFRSAWIGAAQVFATNLGRSETSDVCRTAVLTLLRNERLSEEVGGDIHRYVWGRKGDPHTVDWVVAEALIDALKGTTGFGIHIRRILEWLEQAASRDPLKAIPLFEKLLGGPAGDGHIHHFHGTPLVSALVEILREADQSDDESLIRRAIALQDRCLALDIPGIDEMLDAASALT